VSRLFIVLLATTFLQISSTLAVPRNISIDDSSSEIFYVGAWEKAEDGTDGGHHVASSPTAFATLRFKGACNVIHFSWNFRLVCLLNVVIGIAVYIMSPKWSFPVGTDASLDNGVPQTMDLQYHQYTGPPTGSAVFPSTVVAASTGLINTEHIVRISVGTLLPFAVVDHIM